MRRKVNGYVEIEIKLGNLELTFDDDVEDNYDEERITKMVRSKLMELELEEGVDVISVEVLSKVEN